MLIAFVQVTLSKWHYKIINYLSISKPKQKEHHSFKNDALYRKKRYFLKLIS